MLPVIGALLPIVSKVLDKVIPDKAGREAAKAEIQLKLAEQEGELVQALLQSDVAQAEVNKVEAASDSGFKSGWRPAVGWICVFGLLWSVLLPLAAWGLNAAHIETPPLPLLPNEVLTSLTFGLLGLGGLRTYEKKSGVTK